MSIYKSSSVIILLLLNLVITMSAQTTKRLENFKKTFEKEVQQSGIVGSSFVFLDNNKVMLAIEHGYANQAKNQRVDADTIYHWASNTKPLTGIAIMQLRDRGLLKLDDPITKYVPELRKIHNSYGSMDDITIKHLLTHSGGFRGGTWPWRNNKEWEPFEPTEWSQLVAMFPFTEVTFKPGSKFSYSNPGIIYLGRIIEQVSGESYESYIDKNILRPLEMYNSYFDKTPPHLLPHRSHSYYLENGKQTEGRFDADTGITVSNSGLNSPVKDMIKYANFLVGDPAKMVRYNGILKRSTLEEMWKPQLKTESDANGNRGFTTDIGLVFFIDRSISTTHLGHGGDQNGFLSYLDFDPVKRVASIVVFNTTIVSSSGTPNEKDFVSRLRREIRSLF